MIPKQHRCTHINGLAAGGIDPLASHEDLLLQQLGVLQPRFQGLHRGCACCSKAAKSDTRNAVSGRKLAEKTLLLSMKL